MTFAQIAAAAACVLLVGAPAHAAPAVQAPRMSAVQIDLWPEYDRKGVLVIVNGQLAPDVALPAAVNLRIPATAGAPHAVAYGAAPGGELFNLKHEAVRDGDAIVLRLQVPDRYLHVEFYDALATNTAERTYSYAWPGDVAADRLGFSFKTPAAAGNVRILPKLAEAGPDADGLMRYNGEIGAVPAGTSVPIEVRYAKTDARTSVEILGKAAPAPAPAAAPAPAPAVADRFGNTAVYLALAVVIFAAGVAFGMWLSSRGTS